MQKKEPLIVAKLLGGLGNQLFIYAYARYLQLLNGNIHRIVFDASSYKRNTFNSIDINKLKILKNFEILKNKKSYSISFNISVFFYKMREFLYRKMTHKLLDNTKYDLRKRNKYFFRIKAPIDGNEKTTKNIFMYGYFQNVKYLSFLKDELVDGIQVNYNSDSFTRYFELLSNNKDCAAVSIRCLPGYGKGGFHVYSPTYYERGINYLADKGIRTFFVFADDLKTVSNTFQGKYNQFNFIYVKECSNIEQLSLMSHFKYFVISNSSFSWWGAFLSTQHNKLIIAPNNWWSSISIKDFGLFTSDMILMDDAPNCDELWVK